MTETCGKCKVAEDVLQNLQNMPRRHRPPRLDLHADWQLGYNDALNAVTDIAQVARKKIKGMDAAPTDAPPQTNLAELSRLLRDQSSTAREIWEVVKQMKGDEAKPKCQTCTWENGVCPGTGREPTLDDARKCPVPSKYLFRPKRITEQVAQMEHQKGARHA